MKLRVANKVVDSLGLAIGFGPEGVMLTCVSRYRQSTVARALARTRRNALKRFRDAAGAVRVINGYRAAALEMMKEPV